MYTVYVYFLVYLKAYACQPGAGGRGGSPYNLRLLPKASGKAEVALSGFYVGLMLAYVGPMLRHRDDEFCPAM